MDTLSIRMDTPALELRVGHHSRGGAGRTVGRNVCLAQKQELGPDNPWALDAFLAVAEDTAGRDDVAPGGLVLGTLRECMWAVPASDEEPTLLLPELLAAVDARCETGSERRLLPERALLTLIFVKRGNFYVAREGVAPAYLLRGEELRSLAIAPKTEAAKRTASDEASMRVESGLLEDGDALVCANLDLGRWLEPADIRRALTQSLSPRGAAARLVEQAGERGAPDVAVSVLFAGEGPSTGPRREPTGSFISTPLLNPATVVATLPPTRRSGINIGALAAGLLGALLGIGGGVALVVALLRTGGPGEPTTIRADVQDTPAPYVSPAPLPPSSSGPALPSTGATPSPAPASLAPAATMPSSPGAATFVPETPSRRTAVTQPSQRSSAAPPVVPLASGMSARVNLQLTLDVARGLLLVTANQGILYSPENPRGVPVGTALPVVLEPTLRERIADGQGELRLEPAGRSGMVSAGLILRGVELERLLQGLPVSLSDIPPGDYRLGSAHPDQPPFTSATAMVRVGGL